MEREGKRRRGARWEDNFADGLYFRVSKLEKKRKNNLVTIKELEQEQSEGSLASN